MSRRGFNQSDLDFVACFGRVTYRTGVKIIFLGRRDIPRGFERSHGHLEGITLLVVGSQSLVITSYRNREALGVIKRKNKRASLRSVA